MMDKWKRFWESNQSGWERTKWTPTYTFITGYQPTGKAPDELHPPSCGSGVQNPITINNEPLSTKQLHELITSQAMTIDRLLGEIGRLQKRVNGLEQERRWIPVSERLPENDSYYYVAFLVSGKKYITDIYYFKLNSEHKWYSNNVHFDIATFFDRVAYWTTRPQPPKDAEL